MHISEGFIDNPAILIGGAAAAAAGVAVGVRKMDYERMPQVAVMSSAFFVASLVHVPVGGANAHLILNGLMGLVLGWAAFPAILIGLALQALFFGFGGVTVLGVNTLNMALPAVACYYLFSGMMASDNEKKLFVVGVASCLFTLVFSGVMTGGVLYLARHDFASFVGVAGVAHLPFFILESIITGSIIVFLQKVQPEMLEAPILQEEVSNA